MKKPPFSLNSSILKKVEAIGKELGSLELSWVGRGVLKLRKANKARTIQSSLAIEGNTLSLEDVTCILEGQKVVGPSKDIREVNNAIDVYNDLSVWDGLSEHSFLEAHKRLMDGLIDDNGKWRRKGVGVFRGSNVTHMGPPANRVAGLMSDLFRYINEAVDPWLIKSCVFHYELVFIHPFGDGNGRMGRLWQQVLLMHDEPAFEYVPVEEIVRRYQDEYYDVLRFCDQEANSTKFIEFSLDKILIALREMPRMQMWKLTAEDRIAIAKEKFQGRSFCRKEYAEEFSISSATASRDLLRGLKMEMLEKKGDKATTSYRYKSNRSLQD